MSSHIYGMDNVLPKIREGSELVLTTLNALSFQDALVGVASIGMGVYYIFKRYEPNSLGALSLLLLILPAVSSVLLLPHFGSTIAAVVSTYGVYLSTIAACTVLYRISPFHPLAKVPGPFLNKISKWRMVYITSQGKMHLYYQQLHQRYGDYVRIGPNEVSICDVSAITPLMGPSGWPKGPNWEGRIPLVLIRPVIGIREAKEHTRRRQFWNRGFTSAAIREYEPRLNKRALQLADNMEKQKGSVDLARWLNWYTYDTMGDMVFSGGTDMLHDGDKGGLWHMLDEAQPPSVFLGHIPWIVPIYMKIPGLSASLMKHALMGRARGLKRAQQGSVTKDLYYYLGDECGIEKQTPPISQVAGDGGLAIIAGADTTSTTLANIVYFLLCNPKSYARLQAEVDEYFPPGESPFDSTKNGQMYYLNAVINETLRLNPPLMSGSQRSAEKGKGGKALGPYYFPEGTQAFIHTYTVQHDPRNFYPAPEEFIPERWLPGDQPGSLHSGNLKGEVIHNTAAFVPFSFGPAVCVGKNLAYTQMRNTMCLLMQRFDMRFADGWNAQKWMDDLRDLYVTMRGELPIALTPRSRSVHM